MHGDRSAHRTYLNSWRARESSVLGELERVAFSPSTDLAVGRTCGTFRQNRPSCSSFDRIVLRVRPSKESSFVFALRENRPSCSFCLIGLERFIAISFPAVTFFKYFFLMVTLISLSCLKEQKNNEGCHVCILECRY